MNSSKWHKLWFGGWIALLVLAVTAVGMTPAAQAQDDDEDDAPSATPVSKVLVGEGIAGEIDKHRRGPTVSVETQVSNGNSKILVDAYVAAEEFQKFPIQFQFFVNRQLFATQIRSPELPGPVGIDVSSSAASVPFNYAIVATVLHPNRQYISVIQGAVFATDLAATLDCTVTLGSGDSAESFAGNGVSVTQTGNDSVALSFTAESLTTGNDITVTANATVDDSSLSGSATIKKADDSTQKVDLTGAVTLDDDDEVSSIALDSDDGETTISCS